MSAECLFFGGGLCDVRTGGVDASITRETTILEVCSRESKAGLESERPGETQVTEIRKGGPLDDSVCE